MMVLETVKGGAYEMGLQHGRIFKHVIHLCLDRWVARHDFEQSEEEQDAAVRAQREAQEIECPWVFDELRGIADGSGADYARILRMHLRIWHLNRDVTGPESEPPAPTGCTAIGMRSPEDGVIVGGTLDDPREPYVLMRRMPKDGIPSIMVTWAGTAWGHNGVNDAGLALANASVQGSDPELPPARGTLLQPSMVGRLLLEQCPDVNQGIELLKRLAPRCGFVLGDKSGRMLTYQGGGGRPFFAEPEADMIFCTNHYWIPELLNCVSQHGCKTRIAHHSAVRLATLRKFRTTEKARDFSAFLSLLRSHEGYPNSICNERNVMASAARPEHEPGTMFLATRFPCRGPLKCFEPGEGSS